MAKTSLKRIKTQTRHNRIRAKVSGTKEMPRLCVYRSNKNIFAQIIDDTESKTLVAFSTEKASGKSFLERASNAGKEIAKLAKAKDISKVCFDRGGFIYTGKIKAFADSAREGGLQF
jgi:large subunit ribosomal protein L18